MGRFFLHIFNDEKVVNSFISMMEACFSNENTYLIIAKDGNPKRVNPRDDVISFDENSKQLKQFLSNLSEYKHVCLHSMTGKKFYLYIQHPSISWVIWGFDLYGPLLWFRGYQVYDDKAGQYKARAGITPVWLYVAATTIRDYIKSHRQEKMLDRLSYFITDNGCDEAIFKHYFGDKNILFPGTINYYPIENLIEPSKQNAVCSGDSIWVNNSASAVGNHIWIFEKLKTFSNDTKIICPISYGDKRIANYIDAAGQQILGNKFIPLKDFLPVEEYYSMFLQANAFIFGHFRQCAVGNILMALYFGGKVFLSNRNPLLQMYKDSGVCIYSIEDDLTEVFAQKPLEDEARKTNRDIVLSIASYDSSIMQLKNVFGKIKATVLK